MDAPKTYHPTSFACAAQAVAEALELAAGDLRESIELHGEPYMDRVALALVARALERLDIQSKAMGEIARIQAEAAEYPPVDPDAGGPSWTDDQLIATLVSALEAFVGYYAQAGIGDCRPDDERDRDDGFNADETSNVQQGRKALAAARKRGSDPFTRCQT